MKKNLLLLLAIGNTIFFSCQKKKSDSNSDFVNYNSIPDSITNMNKSMINIDLIKEHIELQKNIDSDEIEHENPYIYSEIDLQLAFQIINEGLKQNGFKNIPSDEFIFKLKNVFKFSEKNNLNCNYNWYYSNITNKNYILYGLSYKIDNTFIPAYTNEFIFNTKNYFFNKKKHYFIELPFLEELIQIDSNNSYKIRLPQYMISRNKYLFNDDKSQFAWLINNDSFFMENLVTNFGYTEDKKLLN
ncbi:hypothetical protein ETU10_10545, partial [Apibacter muscae]